MLVYLGQHVSWKEKLKMKSFKEELIELINKVVEREAVNIEKENKDFGALGIDSIENMNIIFEVQEKYQIDEIPDKDYQELNTLKKLSDYIEKLENN